MSEPHPSIVILAGPNGAGKSTVAPSRSFAPWLADLKNAGYTVDLIFLWLPSAEFAIQRVMDRVRRGGHAVASETVRRRYRSGLRNFFRLNAPLALGATGLKTALPLAWWSC